MEVGLRNKWVQLRRRAFVDFEKLRVSVVLWSVGRLLDYAQLLSSLREFMLLLGRITPGCVGFTLILLACFLSKGLFHIPK